MLAKAADLACDGAEVNRVVLSGGCFFNTLLRDMLTENLRRLRREVYNHDRISPGDAGIAVGQAISCAVRRDRESE